MIDLATLQNLNDPEEASHAELAKHRSSFQTFDQHPLPMLP